jgi:hypothetical protein
VNIMILHRLCLRLFRQTRRNLVVVHDSFSHSYKVHDLDTCPTCVIGSFKTLSQTRDFLLELFRPSCIG